MKDLLRSLRDLLLAPATPDVDALIIQRDTLQRTCETLAASNVVLARRAEAAELLSEQAYKRIKDFGTGRQGSATRLWNWVRTYEAAV